MINCSGSFLKAAALLCLAGAPALATIPVSPVPEPSSMLLVGGAALGLLIYVRRKRARK